MIQEEDNQQVCGGMDFLFGFHNSFALERVLVCVCVCIKVGPLLPLNEVESKRLKSAVGT